MLSSNFQFTQGLLRILASAVISNFVVMSAFAESVDVRGAVDHPLIERFPDTSILSYRVSDFAGLNLATGPLTDEILSRQGRTAMPPVRQVEGHITHIGYRANTKETSILRIYRSFEEAFRQANFTPLFSCASDTECGRNFVVQTYWYGDPDRQGIYQNLSAPNIDSDYNYRYWAGFAEAEGQKYAVSLLVAQHRSGRMAANIALDIVRLEKISLEEITISLTVDSIEQSISDTGRAVLDGIYFDFNKSTLTTQSKDAIGVIADFLRKHPEEEYWVVGHTDNVGSSNFNAALSEDRARAVKRQLVEAEGISTSRLTFAGVGPLSPIAGNETEEGRSKNRRVELVPVQ